MGIENTPQIQVPDQFMNVAPIQPAPVQVSYVNVSQDPPLFQLFTDMIMTAGDKAFSLAASAVMKTVDTVGSVIDRGSQALQNLAPAPSPGLSEGSSPTTPGLAKTPELAYDSMRAEIGQYAAPSTPSTGLAVQRGQSNAIG